MSPGAVREEEEAHPPWKNGGRRVPVAAIISLDSLLTLCTRGSLRYLFNLFANKISCSKSFLCLPFTQQNISINIFIAW